MLTLQSSLRSPRLSLSLFQSLISRVRSTIRHDPLDWAMTCGVQLRPYQRGIALAIKDSIIHHRGLTFVVVLPRQSGKNELQAHIFSWLLFRYSHTGGRIVSVSPTFKPQTTNNMERVRHSLDACIGSRRRWQTSKGYMYKLGKACLQFFSGDSHAQVVGATADLLLSVDEAQEVDPVKFDKDFDPMTASTNATRVFWGTAWTSNTLLERQRRIALHAQQQDGIQRVFFFTADDVRRMVPAYGDHVDRVIAERGRNHPLVRTQFFCETIDAQSGMFTPARISLMFPSRAPSPNGSHLGTSRGGRMPPSADSAPRGADRVGEVPPPLREGGLVTSTSVIKASRREAPSLNPTKAPARGQDLGRGGVGLVASGRGPEDTKVPPSQGEAASHRPRALGGSRLRQPLRLESQGSSTIATQRNETDHSASVSFLIDVAGMDESRTSLASSLASEGLGSPGRDSTTLTIVGIDLSSLPELHHPSYRVLARHAWTGQNHLSVFGQLKNLAAQWSPQHIVIDATGVGEGLWALLDRSFPTRVIPVKFTAQEKSEIGWKFLSIIETGRFHDPDPTYEVRLQYAHCISEILPGPSKTLRWGVPDGTRGPDGELIHDDFILADALIAVLDRLEWTSYVSTIPYISEGFDPLDPKFRSKIIDPLDRPDLPDTSNHFYVNKY